MIGATAGLATMANAQVVPPTVVVTPPPNPSSGASLPSTSPMPGTAVVRLNVRLVADFMLGGGSDNGYKNAQGVTAKAAPYYFGEYARIYPAFDGVTPNGIKYGASLEIRQNSGGIGINNAFANNNGVAGNTLYWRRQTGYVSMDKLGTLRFGQTDGVQTLFQVGTFENFDYEGGWFGDLPGLFSGGQTAGVGTSLVWGFPDSSAFYTTSKLVYLSPNFGGFDFGLDWEPASNQTSGDTACAGTGANAGVNVSTNTISVGCATVTSLAGPNSLIASQLATRRNMTTIGARYRGAFGPVGVVANGNWVHSGLGHAVLDANPFTDPVAYKGFNYFDGGLVGTFGGLAAGGHVDVGAKNATSLAGPRARQQRTRLHRRHLLCGRSVHHGCVVHERTVPGRVERQLRHGCREHLRHGTRHRRVGRCHVQLGAWRLLVCRLSVGPASPGQPRLLCRHHGQVQQQHPRSGHRYWSGVPVVSA